MLKVSDLNVNYGAVHALKGVSLEVADGELVTLIGANGAGKTTTLHAISGLLSVASGAITLDGADLRRTAAGKIIGKGLAHVPEGRHVFSQMTVLENLYMGAYSVKDKSAVQKNVDMVYSHFPRLKERAGQLAGTLSGGEQQMLAIARAMVSRPELLLLDEPSLGLAPIIVKNIFEYIVKIRNEGTTILFVEQNSKIALNTADEGYVMQTGEIILHDTCKDLLANPDVQKAYLGIT